jgi:hypothetical protein
VERWFLLACAGQSLRLSREETVALAAQDEILALALGPDDAPVLDPETASDAALLAQLGAGLERIRLGSSTGAVLSAYGEEALETLLERDLEPELTQAIDLLRAQTQGALVKVAQNIEQLSQSGDRQSGVLLAGALLCKEGANDKASESFRQVLTFGGPTEWAGARALVELGADDASELLARMTRLVGDSGLQFAHDLERALRSEKPGRQVAEVGLDYFAEDAKVRGVSS